MVTKIDDLPHTLLVEILSRLPCNKSASQCKLVSKRWLSLLSEPYFLRRFLRVQIDSQTPVIGTTIFALPPNDAGKSQIFTLSKHPVFETTSSASNFSLRFIPCLRPLLVGCHDDLVVCCKTIADQRDYYLCNPYTKHCVALPPTPKIHETVQVAFLCESYYKFDSGAGGSSKIELNEEYRWKVVRVVPNDSNLEFSVEFFASEIGEWREVTVKCPKRNCFSTSPRVVPYNGMLYWLCHGPVGEHTMCELDLCDTSGDGDIVPNVIKGPKVANNMCMSIWGGTLRLCPVDLKSHCPELKIWEFKEEAGGKGKSKKTKKKWGLVLEGVFMDQMVCKERLIARKLKKRGWHFHYLGSHPTDEDLVCMLLMPDIIVKCNVRERTMERIAQLSVPILNETDVYSVVLPWWPTPVPKVL